jgi:hypothetical protein
VIPVINNDRTVPLQGARAERAVGDQEIGRAPDCLRGQPKTKGPADRRTLALRAVPPQARIPDAAEALISPRRLARATSTIVLRDPLSTMNG